MRRGAHFFLSHAFLTSVYTRDYELDVELVGGATPVLTVYGGKITTYRRLAEHVLAKLKPHLPYMKAPWTQNTALPGGDVADGDLDRLARQLAHERSSLPQELLTALVHRHGALATEVLGDARELQALGTHFGADLYAREVDYLIEHEWARSADDVLWRHTKTGLRLSKEQRAQVADYLAQRFQPALARTTRR